ncbi:MAG: Bcr/CflA family efflux MFS transporter [Pseudomonadota bacterium]
MTEPGDGRRIAGGPRLVMLLGALTALGPFSLQIVAPALPAVSADLAVPPAAAQLLLSLSLLAMAVSTLVWGPLSDRLGRRPVMLGGIWLGILGTGLAALAPGLELAILGRVLQAGGLIAGMVLARAVAQDLYGREGAAGVIGQITAVMVIAPMVAPALSGVLVEQIGWRAIFWAVLGLALLTALVAHRHLPETAPPHAAVPLGATLADMGKAFADLGRRAGFWAYAGFGVASLAAFLFFVGAAPFVMHAAYGLGPQAYGLWFVVMAAAYMAANMACGPISRRLGGVATLRLGAALSFAGIVVGIVLALAGVMHPAALFLPAIGQSIGGGLAVPNAMAGAQAAVAGRAGAASGLMGSAQFAVSGLATQVAGALPHDTALPLFLGMGAILGSGIAIHLLLSRAAPGGPARQG